MLPFWFFGARVAALSGPMAWASLNGASSNVTLSNNDLTATHSNTTGNSGVRSAAVKNSGSFNIEFTTTNWAATGGCVGLITAAGTLTNFVTDGTNCIAIYRSNGAIWSNGANSTLTLGAIVNGDIVQIAINFTSQKVWARKAPSGNWNGQVIGSQNPENGTGGVSFSSFAATTLAPAVGFGAGAANDVVTANFGASSFTGAVPDGFTPGWPL
jgi:hypothetical protein